MTTPVENGYSVILSSRDSATAETRVRMEDSYIRIINSYVQAIALKDADFFVRLSATHIEYLCQLAFEGPPIADVVPRSAELATTIGVDDIAKLHKVARGYIMAVQGPAGTKADAVTRRNMSRELLLLHLKRLRQKEHLNISYYRGRTYKFVDHKNFGIVIQRKDIRGLMWDIETQTTRFRAKGFSDIIKVQGINLTVGHKWKHLRMQASRTWLNDIADWNIVAKSCKLLYVQEARR